MRRTVLLIDDSQDDRLLIERVFHDHKEVDFIALPDGPSAEKLLASEGPLADAIGWILLDFRIGCGGSLDFIRKLRMSSRLRRLPIVVLSGSMSQSELNSAYEAGASSCIRKPVGYDELREMIQALVMYWSRTVELPTKLD